MGLKNGENFQNDSEEELLPEIEHQFIKKEIYPDIEKEILEELNEEIGDIGKENAKEIESEIIGDILKLRGLFGR